MISGGVSIDRFPLPPAPLTQTCIHAARHAAERRPHPADAAIALRIGADVSRDGRVTSLDALMLLQAAAGRIEL